MCYYINLNPIDMEHEIRMYFTDCIKYSYTMQFHSQSISEYFYRKDMKLAMIPAVLQRQIKKIIASTANFPCLHYYLIQHK